MRLFLCAVAFVLAAASAGAADLGRTYPIAEPDFHEALAERGRALDWGGIFSAAKAKRRLSSYLPPDLARLPRAVKGETYYADLTYELPFEVPGPEGRSYPKGYRFNMLDYAALPGMLVVIDGSDAGQISWFRSSPYAADDRTRLAVTGGNLAKLSRLLKRRVYYLDRALAQRLTLTAVPCVCFQRGNLMEVTNFALPTDR